MTRHAVNLVRTLLQTPRFYAQDVPILDLFAITLAAIVGLILRLGKVVHLDRILSYVSKMLRGLLAKLGSTCATWQLFGFFVTDKALVKLPGVDTPLSLVNASTPHFYLGAGLRVHEAFPEEAPNAMVNAYVLSVMAKLACTWLRTLLPALPLE